MTKGDVYKILKEDHKNVKKLLRETLETKDTSKYPQIKKQLQAHMIGEENFLYCAMEFEDEDMVQKNRLEHELAWRMILKLDSIPKSSDEWISNLKELNDLIVHHMEHEEQKNGLFEKAKKVLSEESEEHIIKLYKKEKAIII